MAEVKSEFPVGTPEELKTQRMDPASYGSCSEPVVNHNGTRKNIGCPFWERCQFTDGGDVPKRFQSIKGKGPEHVPVRLVLDNGAISEREHLCFVYMRLHEEYNEIPASGGAVELIDSNEYLYRGTIPKHTMDNGRQTTSHVDDIKVLQVKPYERVAKNPKFAGDAYAAEARKRAAAERRERNKNARLGLTKEDLEGGDEAE